MCHFVTFIFIVISFNNSTSCSTIIGQVSLPQIKHIPTQLVHILLFSSREKLQYIHLILACIVRLQLWITHINHWTSANRLKSNLDKTELLWAGTWRDMPSLSQVFHLYSLLQTLFNIHLRQHVRVFRVIISADLSLEKHVTNISATCYRHLQLRRTLSKDSIATMVHAFATSWVDYCNSFSPGL